MQCDIITIFPELFFALLEHGMIKRAQEKGLLAVAIHNLREFTSDKHRSVDDVPYGGGPGMVMKIEPIHKAIIALGGEGGKKKRILLSPQGRLLNIDMVKRLAAEPAIILICGRYEGIDERVRLNLIDEEVSIGDYVLSGGEIPAMALLEAVVRYIPGALGNQASLEEESFTKGWLEYPHYTRPAEYGDWKVPEILLSGNHEKIKEWRYKQSVLKTARERPDLITWSKLTSQECAWLSHDMMESTLSSLMGKKEGASD